MIKIVLDSQILRGKESKSEENSLRSYIKKKSQNEIEYITEESI